MEKLKHLVVFFFFLQGSRSAKDSKSGSLQIRLEKLWCKLFSECHSMTRTHHLPFNWKRWSYCKGLAVTQTGSSCCCCLVDNMDNISSLKPENKELKNAKSFGGKSKESLPDSVEQWSHAVRRRGERDISNQSWFLAQPVFPPENPAASVLTVYVAMKYRQSSASFWIINVPLLLLLALQSVCQDS